MKFKVQMKDPDGVSESVYQAVKNSLQDVSGVSADELEELKETRREELQDILGKWFQFEEYLTVEIDTETKTIRVCEVK